MLTRVPLNGYITVCPFLTLEKLSYFQLKTRMQSCVHVCALVSLWTHAAKLLSKVALPLYVPAAGQEVHLITAGILQSDNSVYLSF